MPYRIWGHTHGYYVVAHQYPDGTWHDLVLFGDDALEFERDMESVNDRYTLADLVEDHFVGHPESDLCRCDQDTVAKMTQDGYNGHRLLYYKGYRLLYWGD